MPILILIVLVGGPWLLGLVLAAMGAAWLAYQTVIGVTLLIGIGLGALWLVLKVLSSGKRPIADVSFGPLDDEFRAKAKQVEHGIWKTDNYFIVDLNGQGYAHRTIEAARKQRANTTIIVTKPRDLLNPLLRKP